MFKLVTQINAAWVDEGGKINECREMNLGLTPNLKSEVTSLGVIIDSEL